MKKILFLRRKTVPRIAYEVSLVWNLVLLLIIGNLILQQKAHAEYVDSLIVPEIQITEHKEIIKYLQPKSKEYSQKQMIMMDIIDVFGDKADEALMIAKCESKFNPDAHGDTHLMSVNIQTGELIGDSIGIYQVRTGSTNWNRAYKNGMTAEEFRVWMKNPRANIEYAKEIYDNAGNWSPWFNCQNKMLGGK